MKLNVFGSIFDIQRGYNHWIVYGLGNEGKKRIIKDIVIPDDIKEEGLIEYMSDLFHERARPGFESVVLIE